MLKYPESSSGQHAINLHNSLIIVILNHVLNFFSIVLESSIAFIGVDPINADALSHICRARI